MEDTSVVVEEVVAELQDQIAEEQVVEEPSREELVQGLAFRVAQAIRQIYQSGDNVVAVAVNPDLLDDFSAAFKALPDEIVDPSFKEGLPIAPDPSIPSLRVITGTELELQFLQTRYGPRDKGGNGFIQDLEEALFRDRCPIRITKEFLQTYFLFELAEKVRPKLYSPSGAEVLRALPSLHR